MLFAARDAEHLARQKSADAELKLQQARQHYLRLRGNSHRIGDFIPGGMAQVETAWPSEDRMAMTIVAMGQTLRAHVDIEDARAVAGA